MSNEIFLDRLSREKRAGGNPGKAPEENRIPLQFDPAERVQSLQSEAIVLLNDIRDRVTEPMERTWQYEMNNQELINSDLHALTSLVEALRAISVSIDDITSHWSQRLLNMERDFQRLEEINNDFIETGNGYVVSLSPIRNHLNEIRSHIDNTFPQHSTIISNTLQSLHHSAENLINSQVDQLDQAYLSVVTEIELPVRTLHSMVNHAIEDGIISNPSHTQYGNTIERLNELTIQSNNDTHGNYARAIGELYSIIHFLGTEQFSDGIHQRMSQHNNQIAELRAITYSVSLVEEVLDNIETQNNIIRSQELIESREYNLEPENLDRVISSLRQIPTVIQEYNELLRELDENVNLLREFDTTSQLVQNSLVVLEQINTLMQNRIGFISEFGNYNGELEMSAYFADMPHAENHKPQNEPQEEGAVGGCPTGVHDRTESSINTISAGTTFGIILGGSVGGLPGALAGAALGGSVGRLINESGIMETNSCDTQNNNSDSPSPTLSPADLPPHFGGHFEL